MHISGELCFFFFCFFLARSILWALCGVHTMNVGDRINMKQGTV